MNRRSSRDLTSMDRGLAVLEDLPFVVAEKVSLTTSIVQLDIRPLDQPLIYRPGQYVLLSDAEASVPQRSFSIANAPRGDGDIRLLVTRVPAGLTSSWVHAELEEGASLLISGPYGTFTQQLPLDRPVLHLAAGSGLAPILALIEAALGQGATSPITLFFSARTSADVYKRDVFANWEACHGNFTFLRALTRELGAPQLGRIPALLPGLFPELSGFSVFIAGSGGFVEACAEAVIDLGAQRFDVHTEPFFAEPHPWKSPPGAEPGVPVG